MILLDLVLSILGKHTFLTRKDNQIAYMDAAGRDKHWFSYMNRP